jgi:ParB-like chromosome segregation protein Spo0J
MKPADLKNHPINTEIYGESSINEEMLASIKELGVLEPIRATKDGVVLSGHRRKQHAIAAKSKTVPVLVARHAIPDAEQVIEITESNRQREKTMEQKAREFSYNAQARATIKARNSKQNLKKGPEIPERVKSPARENGRAKDEAAAEVGLSRQTADRAAAVVKVIDEKSAAGDEKGAAELRRKLNEESVAAAYRAAHPLPIPREPGEDPVEPQHEGPLLDATKGIVCAGLRSVFECSPKYRGLQNELGTIVTAIEELSNGPSGGRLDLQECKRLAEQLRVQLKFAAPHTECPKCRRNWQPKCTHCKGTGWLTKNEFGACATDGA